MSRSDVPDWIRLACNRWGRQKRRIWQGEEKYETKGRNSKHVDGYAQSFMGRICNERVAAGQPGAARQRWDEVYWGDSLDVQRAIVGMPEGPHDALHVKYVWDPEFNLTWPQRAQLIGMKERVFWESVGRAEYWVFARLEPTDLSLRRESGYSSPITATLPKSPPARIELNFTSLNRPKLTVSR